MTLSRGVIGPIFPNDQPVGLESMFPSGNGRFGKGSGIREFIKNVQTKKNRVKNFFSHQFLLILEYHLFNLATNALHLHYWRLTNQMSGKSEKNIVSTKKCVFVVKLIIIFFR